MCSSTDLVVQSTGMRGGCKSIRVQAMVAYLAIALWDVAGRALLVDLVGAATVSSHEVLQLLVAHRV